MMVAMGCVKVSEHRLGGLWHALGGCACTAGQAAQALCMQSGCQQALCSACHAKEKLTEPAPAARQEHLGLASPAERARLAGVKARLSRQLLPFRDSNGFRKLLVLLTKPGVRAAFTRQRRGRC